MDRAGRRPLLLYPMAVMILILAVITVAIKYQVYYTCATSLLVTRRPLGGGGVL